MAVCPLPDTHPFSAVGSPELWENKEMLAAFPQSWRDRLIHPYHAGHEAQSIRAVHRPRGEGWGRDT